MFAVKRMPFSIGSLLLKLLPGAVAIIIIGGLGFLFGTKMKQSEIDRLQAQLTDYQTLGQHITDLKKVIDTSIKDQNKILIDAYTSEIGKMRADFRQIGIDLATATVLLKEGGNSVKSTAATLVAAIGTLPVGSAEREAKIAEILTILKNPRQMKMLCTVTPVAEEQLVQLNAVFSKGAP